MAVPTNFFSLFQLPQSYRMDEALLAERYRALQRTVHPDRYANASPQEKRLAVQRSGLINEAHQVLREPLARARHLLECAGVTLDEESSVSGSDFLLLQMEWRERLAAAADSGDGKALNILADDVGEQWNAYCGEFVAAMQTEDLPRANDEYRRMQFIDKMKREIKTMRTSLAG